MDFALPQRNRYFQHEKYANPNLKRFGDYPTDLAPETMPMAMTLPIRLGDARPA
jgi:hypothetical protein